MARTALEVVTLYNMEVWNKGRFDLIPELCGSRIVRHDANSVTVLELDEQIARIKHNYEELKPTFEPVVLAGDDEYVTLVWNVTGRDPNWKWCGIEIFRVENGKIVEVWNSPYVDGRWSQEGKLWASVGGAAPTSLPAMSVDMENANGKLVVPLDGYAITTWLTLAFGEPVSTSRAEGSWEHHFTPGRQKPDLALSYAEGGRATSCLTAVGLDRMEIKWARSGLVNVDIDLTGVRAADGKGGASPDAAETVRLAECIGGFTTSSGVQARVVGASIELGGAGGKARGELTLRLPEITDPAEVCGTGPLDFGWQHGLLALQFEAAARVSQPTGAFVEAGEVEAVYRWETDSVSCTLCNDRAP